MTDEEIDRIKILAAQFGQDREMEGFSEKTTDRTMWGLRYFYGFLKERDEETLHAVTGETLHQYQMHLFNAVGRRGKPLCLGSQLNALGSVRVLFRWLVRRGHVLADPSTAIALPKRGDPLPKNVLTRREMERVLNTPDVDTPKGLRDRAILELMYSTGLRNMEVRNLKVYDVNTAEGEVHVRGGKGGEDRVTPLGQIAGKYVDLYVKEARPKFLVWGEDSGYLFLGRYGQRLNKRDGQWKDCPTDCRGVGIEKTRHGARVPSHVRDTPLKRPRVLAPHSTVVGSQKFRFDTGVFAGGGGGLKTRVETVPSPRTSEESAAMTIVEAQNAFLKWLEAKGHAPSTRRSRSSTLGEFVSFLKSRFVSEVGEVTRELVEEYRRRMTTREHRFTGQRLAVSTVIGHLVTVKLFFRFLVERKRVMFDPSGTMVLPQQPSRLPRSIPSEGEMEAILFRPDMGTPTGMRDRAVLELLYSTGMRRAEAAGLDLYDVNLADRTVTIRTGKGGKGRTVPVGRSAIQLLTRYIQEARPGMIQEGGVRDRRGGRAPTGDVRRARSAALFVIPGGGRLSKDNLGKRVSGYVKEVTPGVARACHAIRHAFATHMLRGGAEMVLIQRMLGHATIRSTEIYAQVTAMDLKKEHHRCHPRKARGTVASAPFHEIH